MFVMNSETLLKIQDVSKSFLTRNLVDQVLGRPKRYMKALSSVSFELKAGQVTALLGPNGAGKTTLVNIICDLTRADSGRVKVAGLSVPEDGFRAQRQIGYVTTNDRSFFWRLNGRKNLEFFAALEGYSVAEAARRSTEMLLRFNLVEAADRPFHTYSAGMKKRLGLARAFLHDPAILLMDEPTNGLDARSTEELLELVQQEVQPAGKTVLWATHRADEVERLCDRVIVLIGGQVSFHGSVDEFIGISKRHMGFVIEALVQPEGEKQFSVLAASLGLAVGARKANGGLDVSGVGDEAGLSSVLAAVLSSGVLIRQVERQPEPLHKVFAHLEMTKNQFSASVATATAGLVN